LGTSEEKISELEDTALETIQNEAQRNKRQNKNKQRSSEQWDNIKQSNIHEFGVPKGKEIWGGRGQEKTFEEISWYLNLGLMSRISVRKKKKLDSEQNSVLIHVKYQQACISWAFFTKYS